MFAPTDEAFEKFAGKDIGKKEATQIVNKHLVRTLQKNYPRGLKRICFPHDFVFQGERNDLRPGFARPHLRHPLRRLHQHRGHRGPAQHLHCHRGRPNCKDHGQLQFCIKSLLSTYFSIENFDPILQYLVIHFFAVFNIENFDVILQELNQHATNGVIHAIDKIL